MSHWTYANQTPSQDEGWRGVMTMPRVLSLNNGALMQRPPEEFLKWRGEPSLIAEEGIACHSQAFELEMEVDFSQLRTADVGIRSRNDAEEFAQIIYNQESGELCIDRRQAGRIEFHPDFAGVFRAPLPIPNQLLKLNIFVDSCSVELFAQEGLLYGAALVFPSAVWRKIELYRRWCTNRTRRILSSLMNVTRSNIRRQSSKRRQSHTKKRLKPNRPLSRQARAAFPSSSLASGPVQRSILSLCSALNCSIISVSI